MATTNEPELTLGEQYQKRIIRKSVVFDPSDQVHAEILEWFARNKEVSFSAKAKQLIHKELIERNQLTKDNE